MYISQESLPFAFSRHAILCVCLGVGCSMSIAWGPVFGQEDSFDLSDAIRLEREGQYQQAFDLLSKQITETPERADLYYWRGRSAFCLARVEEAVADFDRLVELAPDLEPRQWERGIALYYAHEYEKGAKQFELYQTYHDNDVENSTWRFMCVAAHEDLEAAEENMLPIRNDQRVPMMEIFAMFAGEADANSVLETAAEDSGSEAANQRQLFYAHLYVGLYLEAQGESEAAMEHMVKACELKIDHYMWNVADVHVKLNQDE